MRQNGKQCQITPSRDATATDKSNDNSKTDDHSIQLTDNHSTTNHFPLQNAIQTPNHHPTTHNALPNVNNTHAPPSDINNPSLNYIRNPQRNNTPAPSDINNPSLNYIRNQQRNNTNNNMLQSLRLQPQQQPQQLNTVMRNGFNNNSNNNQNYNGLANLMAALQNIQSMQNTNNSNTYRPSSNINALSNNNSILRERMKRSEDTRKQILNHRMRRHYSNNNRNTRRSPQSSDNERSRSRSRDRRHNITRQPLDIHHSTTTTAIVPAPTPIVHAPTATPVVPTFPSIQNVIDKSQAVSIYNSICNASSPFSNNVIALIAEFSIGTIFDCNNNSCDKEVVALESGDTMNGMIKNPQSVIQPVGRIDANNTFICFCDNCMNITRTCGLNIRRFKMRDQIRNIFGGNFGGNIVFNGGRGCFSDLCEFEQLVCSQQYIDNNNNTYCNECRNGKQIPIGNMQIVIKCDETCQEYRIGAERHQMFAYGGDSHTNLGGLGGSNVHNNVRYNGGYNGGYNGYY